MSVHWRPTVDELASAFHTTKSGGRYPFGRYRLQECQAFRDALLQVPNVTAVTIDQTSPDWLYVTVYQENRDQ